MVASISTVTSLLFTVLVSSAAAAHAADQAQLSSENKASVQAVVQRLKAAQAGSQAAMLLVETEQLLEQLAQMPTQEQTAHLPRLFELGAKLQAAAEKLPHSSSTLAQKAQAMIATINTLNATQSMRLPSSNVLLGLSQHINVERKQPGSYLLSASAGHSDTDAISSIEAKYSFWARALSFLFSSSSDSALGERSCKNTRVEQPKDPSPLVSSSDFFTARTSEVTELAQKLATPVAAAQWVQKNIHLIKRYGATQSATQVLRSRSGTAIDKATLLVSLFRAKGIPAQYLLGERLVSSEELKNIYAVDSDKDLAWAHYLLLKDYFRTPTDMVRMKHGMLSWILPTAWVQAKVDGRWIRIDVASAKRDYSKGSLLEISGSHEDVVSNYLFAAEAGQSAIKQDTLVDQLMANSSVKQELVECAPPTGHLNG